MSEKKKKWLKRIGLGLILTGLIISVILLIPGYKLMGGLVY